MQDEMILTTISKTELLGFIGDTINQALKNNEKPKTKHLPEDEFEPRDETMKRLRVRSYATMIKYERKGILKPYRLGRSIFYKKSQVTEALKHFNRV